MSTQGVNNVFCLYNSDCYRCRNYNTLIALKSRARGGYLQRRRQQLEDLPTEILSSSGCMCLPILDLILAAYWSPNSQVPETRRVLTVCSPIAPTSFEFAFRMARTMRRKIWLIYLSNRITGRSCWSPVRIRSP